MIRIMQRCIAKDASLYKDSLNPSLAVLMRIFGKDRRPPAHILGFELLHFIQSERLYESTHYIVFPIMKDDYAVHKNITLFHLSLINQRLQYEETQESLKQSYLLFEICEKYLFERYLDLVEDLLEVPVDEFEAELVEMIYKDFCSIDNSIACYGYKRPFIVLEERSGYGMNSLALNEIFENKIPPFDPQLSLFLDYFAAHKSYLEQLTYHSFLTEKINWGLQFLTNNQI